MAHYNYEEPNNASYSKPLVLCYFSSFSEVIFPEKTGLIPLNNKHISVGILYLFYKN